MPVKFIVDNNVGKLAVWLRILGYDTVFVNPIDDSELIDIARREKRVILTKDTGIMHRRVVTGGQLKALLIKGTDWRDQLVQVVRAFRLKTGREFTRCLECNTLLQSCTPQQAAPHVPPAVRKTQREFFFCRQCERYFWQGSHWHRMNGVLAAVLNKRSR